LKLLDTPGPNEAGAKLDKEFEIALKKTDVVVYVLDYTKLGSNDEANMFEELRKSVQPLLQSAGTDVQRIFYVLNKVDNHSKRNDPAIEVTLTNVANRISTVVGKKVPAGHIIPISSQLALLARQVKTRTDDRGFLADFLRKAMGECWEDEVEEHEYKKVALEKAGFLEKRSGFRNVEEKAITEVAKNKTQILAHAAADALIEILNKRENELMYELAAASASTGPEPSATSNLSSSSPSAMRTFTVARARWAVFRPPLATALDAESRFSSDVVTL